MSRNLQHSISFRTLRLVLTLASLVALVATAVAPSVDAAGNPSVTATGQAGGVYVVGSGFSPGVSLRLEVLTDEVGRVLQTQTIEPQSCSAGGCFTAVMSVASYAGQVWVVADQSGFPSTWSQTVVTTSPYITPYSESGPSYMTFVVTGGGYAPQSSVTVEVWQLRSSGKHVLNSVTTTAVLSNPSDLGYGTIVSDTLEVPAHSGWVYVSTVGGAASGSNGVPFYIS